MPNPENLKPFKQGEDERRNKDGRPPGSRNRSTIAREMLSAVISMPEGEIKERLKGLGLTTQAEGERLLTAVLIANGLSGVNPEKCYKELMDSAHGQAKQQIEMKNDEEQGVFKISGQEIKFGG